MGGNVKVNREEVDKVLALFDKEDIDYINFEYLKNNDIIEVTDDKKEDKKEKEDRDKDPQDSEEEN